MIRGHSGWYRFLFRTWGGLSNYLYAYIAKRPSCLVSGGMDKHTYHFLSTKKPQTWYRNPVVTKHSFYAQERHIWLQMALVVFHRFLADDLPAEMTLVTPYHNFPSIGLEDDELILMFCDRLHNQNRVRFLEMLEEAREVLSPSGKPVRWIHPLSNNLDVPIFHNDWPENMEIESRKVWSMCDSHDLHAVLNPTLEDSFFQVNMSEIHQALCRR